MLEITQLYLEKDQKVALKRLALQRSEQAGKTVSMAQLVRASINVFLASLPCETEQARPVSVQEDAIAKPIAASMSSRVLVDE